MHRTKTMRAVDERTGGLKINGKLQYGCHGRNPSLIDVREDLAAMVNDLG